MFWIVVRPIDKVSGNQNGVETVRVVLQRLSLELLEGGMELLRRGLAAVDAGRVGGPGALKGKCSAFSTNIL